MHSFALVALAAVALPSGLAQTTPRHRTQATHKTAPAPKQAITGVPDLIYFDGIIYTGNGFADDKPETVEAIAVKNGKIEAVGTTEEITRLAGPNTKLRDLNSRNTSNYIFPGFNDAHVHLADAGETKLNVDLTGVKSLADMLARVQGFARKSPPGHWLVGGGWDHTLWAEKVLPTRQDLDRVTGDHPAIFSRIDGHIAVANTAALKAAGISGATKAPRGGAIDLDANGEPTGIIRDTALGLVEKVVPPPTPEERRQALELAISDAVAHGVTSVQDFSTWDDFLVYEQMEKEGKLDVRISEWLPFVLPLAQLKQMRAHHDANDPMLHTGMLKGFMDGSLGSRTAALKAPYADDPGNTGLARFTQEQLNQMAIERAGAGFQMGFHAIGDKATSMALDAFAAAEQAAGRGPRAHLVPCRMRNGSPCPNAVADSGGPRYRVEHAQVVDPADIPRFKALGVIASMQPNHLLTDMNWAEARLGPKRAAYSYAWKAFLDAGVPLAFGTDYPVEPISPYRGVYAAVTRMNEKGTQTYFPQNKITRGQALYAYTQGSAYAEFAESRKGKLEPGYDADFVIVDRDLYKVGAPALLYTEVVGTFVGGREVFPPASDDQ